MRDSTLAASCSRSEHCMTASRDNHSWYRKEQKKTHSLRFKSGIDIFSAEYQNICFQVWKNASPKHTNSIKSTIICCHRMNNQSRRKDMGGNSSICCLTSQNKQDWKEECFLTCAAKNMAARCSCCPLACSGKTPIRVSSRPNGGRYDSSFLSRSPFVHARHSCWKPAAPTDSTLHLINHDESS